MEILQDRVSADMISVFNALGSDPYLAYKWLCKNHGPESQGISEKVSMCNVFIDLKMKPEERFSAFFAKFDRMSKKIGCPETLALTYLMSDRTKNTGNRQMLTDRLMDAVEDCRKLSRGTLTQSLTSYHKTMTTTLSVKTYASHAILISPRPHLLQPEPSRAAGKMEGWKWYATTAAK
jgi:hypothetical protein